MRYFLFILSMIILTSVGFAQPNSLKGLDTAKLVVDLNQGNAKKLKTRIGLILETMDNITEHGTKIDVVVAVRGGASNFMTINDDHIDEDEGKIKAQISNLTSELAKRGVKLEQCAVALRFLKIDAKEVQPKFKVVQNGYVSLIGYQNKGYAVVVK